MKSKIITLLVILFAITSIKAQDTSTDSTITVYKTYQDYQSKTNSETYDSFRGMGHVMGDPFFFMERKKKDKTYKVKMKSMWGYTYLGKVHVINKDNDTPFTLVASGQICYFENALNALGFSLSVRDSYGNVSTYVPYGDRKYISKSIDSEFIRVKKSDITKFMTKNPEYKEVCECILADKTERNIADCVKASGTKK